MSNEPTDGSTFERVWQGLSENQKRYVLARKEHTSKSDAAEAVGLNPDTVYRWSDEVERAVELLLDEAAANARVMLEQAVAKAALTKIDGLDSSNEWVQQTAAKEILDRVLGKAVKRKEVSESSEEQVTFALPENGREGASDDD